jgi:hypothetical protein
VEQGTGEATQFEYGPQSAFFEKIRQFTTFIEGVPVLRPGGDPHVAGQIHFMTGGVIPADGAEMSKYPSIDQILAKQSPLFAGALATPSVTWCGHTQGDGARAHIHIISFDDAAVPQPIFPQNSPTLAYSNLFAGFMPGQTSDAQARELAIALKQNRSVLDYTRGSVERLMARVSAAEKVRLDTHLQALRELEMRLAQMPEKPPEGAFNDTVAVFSCSGSYPTGLYPVSSLRVPVYGPRQREFPSEPARPMPDDWEESLASVAEIAVTEDRCFRHADELGRLGFGKVVTRTRPPSTRGQLYSLWFK